MTHAFFVAIALGYQAALQVWRQRARQKMRRRSFDFIQHAAQVRNDHQAKLFRGAGSQSASFLKGGDQAVERNVLAEEEDLVLVVVKVGGGKIGGGSDVAHTGFRHATNSKLFARGAQDLKAARQIATAKTDIAAGLGSVVWQLRSPRLNCPGGRLEIASL